jgi:hypothetical protein
LGNLYAPKQSAAIWHGAASKGIRAVPILGPLYELYMPAANASVQLILGFSGFHYANIGMQGPAASAELALSDALDKNWKGALANVARSSGASVLDAALGKQVLEQYRNPGMHPELEAGIQAMLAGGYQGTAEAEWFTGDRMQRLKDAFREAWNAENPGGKRLWNGVKIPLDAIYAGIELQMVPLMKWYVPAMKAGATYRAVMDELAKLPPGADRAMLRSRMSVVQKEMDYRYGQVIYSNFFMDNLLKDLAHAIFLAPGWSAGSAMLLARGLTQVPYRLARRILGKMGKGKKLDEEIVGRTTRYMWAELAVLGVAGGLLTWMLTGQAPKEPKDFYFPRDGTTDQDGNPNRFTIPGYPSRDWYDWPTHPLRTLMNKTKPFGAAFFRLLANRDYFGNMYYDPDEPTMAKVRDIAKGAASEAFVPLSARNIAEQRRRAPGSSPLRATGGFFGIAPAKKEIQRTEAQNLLAEYLARRGRTALTPEQQTAGRARADTVAALRRGEPLTASKRLESRAEEPALVTRFKQLSLDEAEKVYEAGTPQEQSLWASALATKRTNAGEGGGRVRRPRARRRSR